MNQITKIDIYEISSGINSLVKDVNGTLEKITNKPLHKKIFYKFFPKSEFKELQEAVEILKVKKNKLYEYKESLKILKLNLENENSKIDNEIKKLKEKNGDIEIIVQLESKYVVNKEFIENQIPIINELISNTLIKLEKSLPFLEQTIQNQLAINVAIKSLSIIIDDIITLENYSKKLEKENSELINKLVTSSTEKIINSIDIDYYKNMKERNKQLRNKFAKAKENYFKKLMELEKELINIKEEKWKYFYLL